MVPGQNAPLISQFMNERTHVECPHTKGLDGIWYCKNIPVDESCAFDEEDGIILNTFGNVPVTIVFIGMNALASRLKAQHLARVGKDRNLRVTIGERTRRMFEATCMVPLKELCQNRASEAITLKKVSVFHERGTREDFCELVRITCDSLDRYRASRAAEFCFRLSLLRESDPDEMWSQTFDKGRMWNNIYSVLY
ncbi:hypothetical protein JAAARDRAFT_342942 [Jaapia argillacea MUCL 33604]|uniref:Uncharacterized protein n=1 Tax=Jaapia argillacea MUCL 33604 TaxID=933084 RepID=A0A067PJT7_9AGAM|nr:hypothetical protein JAAARDRAFT_342942 [Jaapia argillacea MUCL 33604]